MCPCMHVSLHKYAYYHQIQGQLALCKLGFCDFVCWTPVGMHTERIHQDPSYFSSTKPSFDRFFVKIILELLLTGRSVTTNKEFDVSLQVNIEVFSTSNSVTHSQPDTYFWCGEGESCCMIACDNPSCTIEWFDFECISLSRKPRGRWFCSDSCRNAF